MCPVDGAISQFGVIAKDQIFQAKGHSYSTTALVGGDAALARSSKTATLPRCTLAPRTTTASTCLAMARCCGA